MYWVGQVEVLSHQLHAFGIHKLKRRQDLAQLPLAGAEGLQNLSKPRAACDGIQCIRHHRRRTMELRASPTTRPDVPSSAATSTQLTGQVEWLLMAWCPRKHSTGQLAHKYISRSLDLKLCLRAASGHSEGQKESGRGRENKSCQKRVIPVSRLQ